MCSIFLGIIISKGYAKSMISGTLWCLWALCVFRIVYLFMLADDDQAFDSLSNFAMAEIPTFLYFTAFSMIFSVWVSMSTDVLNNTRESERRRRLVIIFIISGLVWALFIIVMVIQGVVIPSDEEKVACEGRVAEEGDDEDDQTRVLSICYQSVIICFTFLMCVGFVYSYVSVRKNATLKSSSSRVFRIAGLAAFAFLLRCVFFIIILAGDFESTIYMFIVLMITEVFVVIVLPLQFGSISSAITSNMSRLSTRGTRTGQTTEVSPSSGPTGATRTSAGISSSV